MFRRVLKEGIWENTVDHTSSLDRPWAVLLTGVNGIHKTTNIYQDWFVEVLAKAFVLPPSGMRRVRRGAGEGGGGDFSFPCDTTPYSIRLIT